MCCKKICGVDLDDRRDGQELGEASVGDTKKRFNEKNTYIQFSRMTNMLETSRIGLLVRSSDTYIIAIC